MEIAKGHLQVPKMNRDRTLTIAWLDLLTLQEAQFLRREIQILELPRRVLYTNQMVGQLQPQLLFKEETPWHQSIAVTMNLI